MKKIISILSVAIILVFSVCCFSSCENSYYNFIKFTVEDLEEKMPSPKVSYTLKSDDTYAIVIRDLKNTKHLKIPKTHLGKPVTEIRGLGYTNPNLKSVTIPDSVTTIGILAFMNCTGLTSITIPDSVTTISEYAFTNCVSLTSITIPDSVEAIYSSFDNCSALENIFVSEENTEYKDIDGNLYSKDGTTLIRYAIGKTNSNFVVPNGVTSIDSFAFDGGTSLKSVTIPDSVVIHSSFYNCSALENIFVSEENTKYKDIDGNLYSKDGTTLIQYAIGKTDSNFIVPDGVTSIDSFAFDGCTSLESVTIPASVSNIASSAFSGYVSIKNIFVSEENAEYIDIDGNLYSKDGTLIRYAIGKTEPSFIIPEGVTAIGEHAFEYCTSLVYVDIPNSVIEISSRAFSNCSSLVFVAIPNGVTTIEFSAFEYCTSLTSVVIPNSVTHIEDGAFACCTSLTSVVIPDSVTSIDAIVFGYCESLKSITISNNMRWIETSAFVGCNSLKDVYYSGSSKEWNNMIVDSGNAKLMKAKIHFNYIP